MSLAPFATSRPLSLGVELELQIVDPHHGDLKPAANHLLAQLPPQPLPGEIKPEVTCSMIELSTGICSGHDEVLAQLGALRDALVQAARTSQARVCGGGTHPFQVWSERRIQDTARFRQIESLYGYLAKQFTVFGQHVHVGCADGDQALRLLHGLSRYVPHLIALSAASPFVEGHDTRFQSARSNVVHVFPLSGHAPPVTRWSDLARYYERMSLTGIVTGMKDFYWDIRPKPEYGTVEVRVLDTPLTIGRAAALAALVQTLAHRLLAEPAQLNEDDYLPYAFNRFQASRYGLDADHVDPQTGRRGPLRDAVLQMLDDLTPHAMALGCRAVLEQLAQETAQGYTDAARLRAWHAAGASLPELVSHQAALWAQDELAQTLAAA